MYMYVAMMAALLALFPLLMLWLAFANAAPKFC
jgi:hypothetical protein